MYLDPEERIRRNRDGKPVLLPNPSVWNYSPEMIDEISQKHHSSVLISGPTGCGKEELAGILADKGRPFIAVNCSGLDGPLVDSELFGHVEGAFTGAVKKRDGILLNAGDGTVFLDEIGRMPLGSQARLLRYMQTGEIRPVGDDKPLATKSHARVIAATNQHVGDPEKFLPDLLQRFDFRLELPRLADRGADALFLMALPEFAPRNDVYTALSLGAACAVLLYDWPGNIRELVKYRSVSLTCRNPSDSRDTQGDPWPAGVLHHYPADCTAFYHQLNQKIRDFCMYVMQIRLRLFTNPSFVARLERDIATQHTAALLCSIPWIADIESFDNPPFAGGAGPFHPHILPFPWFRVAPAPFEYANIKELEIGESGLGVSRIFYNRNFDSSKPATLPTILENLVWHFRNGADPACIEGSSEDVKTFSLSKPIKDVLMKIKYPNPYNKLDQEFEEALSQAHLDTKYESVCRAVYAGKRAGKTSKEIAPSLGIKLSTLNENIATIRKGHPDLKKFIATRPGRPSKVMPKDDG